VLGTYVPGRQESEILEDEDVTPATTVFSTQIASRLEGDLAIAKKNFLSDIDGLEILISGPNLPQGPLSGINLGSDTLPTDADVGLVAFSVTALFNIFHKNDLDVDFPAAIDDLTDKRRVDPDFLADQGVSTDQMTILTNSIIAIENQLGTDLATALSTARVKVRVMSAEDGGSPISGAVVNIENQLDCDGCGDATDANGLATLTLRGIPKEATTIRVTVSSVPGFEPVTVTTEVVAFATVDLAVYPGAIEVCDDMIDNDGDGDTDCADTDCFSDIACSDGVDLSPYNRVDFYLTSLFIENERPDLYQYTFTLRDRGFSSSVLGNTYVVDETRVTDDGRFQQSMYLNIEFDELYQNITSIDYCWTNSDMTSQYADVWVLTTKTGVEIPLLSDSSTLARFGVDGNQVCDIVDTSYRRQYRSENGELFDFVEHRSCDNFSRLTIEFSTR
jgi:hypothetical protein